MALYQDGAVAGQVGDGELGNGVLADPDVAAAELMVAGKRCEQCRLSSTIRSQESKSFSLIYLKRNIKYSTSMSIVFGHMFHFNN